MSGWSVGFISPRTVEIKKYFIYENMHHFKNILFKQKYGYLKNLHAVILCLFTQSIYATSNKHSCHEKNLQAVDGGHFAIMWLSTGPGVIMAIRKSFVTETLAFSYGFYEAFL